MKRTRTSTNALQDDKQKLIRSKHSNMTKKRANSSPLPKASSTKKNIQAKAVELESVVTMSAA